MDKDYLIELINDGKSTREIAKLFGNSQSTVKYWLNKYNLKTCYSGKPYLCTRCGEDNPDKFYGHQKSTCKRCRDIDSLALQNEKRLYAVNLLGGCCSVCGYDKYIGSLDIHHTDPSIKDDEYYNLRSWSCDRIKKELDSCVLLCANCHREEHNRLKGM